MGCVLFTIRRFWIKILKWILELIKLLFNIYLSYTRKKKKKIYFDCEFLANISHVRRCSTLNRFSHSFYSKIIKRIKKLNLPHYETLIKFNLTISSSNTIFSVFISRSWKLMWSQDQCIPRSFFLFALYFFKNSNHILLYYVMINNSW